MEAKINKEIVVNLNQIKIGKYNLSEIFSKIHSRTELTIEKISFERQNAIPDLDLIDSDLCYILDLIEEIQHF